MTNYYKSKRWRIKRESILKRDGYQCQISKRFGKIVEANTVHHIFPRRDFPEFAWENWNLISISAEKHAELHDRESDKLTQKGLDLLRRTARERKIDFNWAMSRMS